MGAYIGGAYFFTSSTSFANPAVTIGRAFSDTFAGIRPVDAPGFIAAQLCAAIVVVPVFSWLFGALAARADRDETTAIGPVEMKEQRR